MIQPRDTVEAARNREEVLLATERITAIWDRTKSISLTTDEVAQAVAAHTETALKEKDQFIMALLTGTLEGQLRARVRELEAVLAGKEAEIEHLKMACDVRIVERDEAYEEIKRLKDAYRVDPARAAEYDELFPETMRGLRGTIADLRASLATAETKVTIYRNSETALLKRREELIKERDALKAERDGETRRANIYLDKIKVLKQRVRALEGALVDLLHAHADVCDACIRATDLTPPPAEEGAGG